MVNPTPFPLNKERLRSVAEANLKQGTAPLTNGWALSEDALTLLYELASAPDSAADGLKLLHELQVQQVELDLQREQLETNEGELTRDLAHYEALYEFAPVGYLVVDPDGRIMESNGAGAELLGVERSDLGGRPVKNFLEPDSRAVLAGLLEALCPDGRAGTCEVRSGDSGDGSRRLRIDAALEPDGENVLMIVSEPGYSPAA